MSEIGSGPSTLEVSPIAEETLDEVQKAMLDHCMKTRAAQIPNEDPVITKAECLASISQQNLTQSTTGGDAKDQGSIQKCVESCMGTGKSEEECKAECGKLITSEEVNDAFPKPFVGKQVGDSWQEIPNRPHTKLKGNKVGN